MFDDNKVNSSDRNCYQKFVEYWEVLFFCVV